MKPVIVRPDPKYAPPAFLAPPAAGYLHLAAAVAPPTGPPFVRKDAARDALLARLKQLATELTRHWPEISQATVYRAVLVPPTGHGVRHPARYDVAVLVETTAPDSVEEIRAAQQFQNMLGEVRSTTTDLHLMPARCRRYLGAVDRARQGLFLFNHFVGDDTELATALWEHLAGWYVSETGLANSTLLAPTGQSDYVLVNHARWDKSLLSLTVEQFSKPTFYRYVRANLRANDIVAMPVLYRLA